MKASIDSVRADVVGQYQQTFRPTGFSLLQAIKGLFFSFVLLAIGLYSNASCLQAQTVDRRSPTLTYFAAFNEFYAGNYKGALNLFQSEARGAIKTPQSRWIDSICYETMIGECLYQMGMLDQALEHYSAALEIYVVFPDWMVNVQFPPLRSAGPHKPLPWGVSTRHSQLGMYPSTMKILQGRINNNEVFQQGGVYQQAIFYSIQPQEIVRCTTLALRRRMELLGPLCKYDPLTDKLIVALSRSVGPANHWSEAWGDVQRGLALIAAGKEGQGVTYLQRSILAAGEFDHPMTSIALLELGRIKLLHGEYQEAAKFFEEATYSAVEYPDSGVLEEAFRYRALIHLLANDKGFFTPLATALQWAKVKELQQFRASLALCAAENYAVLGQSREATAMLDEARATINRRKMSAPRLGSRLSYLSALVSFQQGKIKEGQIELNSVMAFLRQSSRWLFQIALADKLYVAGRIAPRAAMDLYSQLLRDPATNDWFFDPMESLAVLVNPHPISFDCWFEAAQQRRELDLAWDIADRARRHRFFTSLPLGGRLESLRWIFAAPADMLNQQAQLQQKTLLLHWPQYARLAEQAQAIRAKIAARPLVTKDQDLWKQQSKAMAELSALSMRQEALLREIALCREPAAMVFPPLRTTDEVRKSLPEGHALLVFFAANRRLYAYLMNSANYSSWEVESPQLLSRQITAWLREMGQYQPNHELTLKDLTDAKWNQQAQKLLETLLKGSQADFTKPFDELVIVPDDVLWYVPFEALQVSVGGQTQSLISRFRIRYAPTMSLATAFGAGQQKPISHTAVVVGKLFPREDESAAKKAFDRLAAVLPGTVALKSPPPGPTDVYKVFFDRLIVFDDLQINEQDPYDWSPMPIDRGKTGGTLRDWMGLPWGSPGEIILPGYHTAAEDSLKRAAPGIPGNDVFLSVCGLMSCGTRTLLLSRWRTGGQSSFDLVREFAQELPYTSPADAWQRAVLLENDTPLNLEAEPRVRTAPTEETLKADHPFFWAGYMLIDSGRLRQNAPTKTGQTPKKPDKPNSDEAKP
jgi:CHAT domain-containing protein